MVNPAVDGCPRHRNQLQKLGEAEELQGARATVGIARQAWSRRRYGITFRTHSYFSKKVALGGANLTCPSQVPCSTLARCSRPAGSFKEWCGDLRCTVQTGRFSNRAPGRCFIGKMLPPSVLSCRPNLSEALNLTTYGERRPCRREGVRNHCPGGPELHSRTAAHRARLLEEFATIEWPTMRLRRFRRRDGPSSRACLSRIPKSRAIASPQQRRVHRSRHLAPRFRRTWPTRIPVWLMA